MDLEQFYSTFEVARICQVSAASVTRWIHEGKIVAARTVGGHHRVKGYEIVKLLETLNMTSPEREFKTGATKVKKYKFLIVDDEDLIRQMLRLVISEAFPGSDIAEASEGFSAGWKAHSMIPNLILLDIMLPGLDGYQVCQFIKAFSELKQTRIIAMSGLRGEDRKKKILEIGANDFIGKPFDLDDLRNKINGCIYHN